MIHRPLDKVISCRVAITKAKAAARKKHKSRKPSQEPMHNQDAPGPGTLPAPTVDLMGLQQRLQEAEAKWRAAREAHIDIENKDIQLWDEWNTILTEMFLITRPDIAEMVAGIKALKRQLEAKETELRTVVQERGLKLPLHILD